MTVFKNIHIGKKGPPKYELYEIAQILNIGHRLLASKFGTEPNPPKMVLKTKNKRFYDKDEVIAWYKNIDNNKLQFNKLMVEQMIIDAVKKALEQK
jgi:hypothetical protein